jgi:hypothetical protein
MTILGDGGITTSKTDGKLAVKTPSLVESTKCIDINSLVLSDTNPRISQHGSNLSQDEIRKIIWDEWDARSLMKRILEDGQIYEDIYVQTEGNKFVIHEGSTRAVSVMQIVEDIRSGKLKGVSENDFRKMSCKVIRANATEAEIRQFLTQIHVAGKTSWVTLSNAEQVYLMIQKDGKTIQGVADHLSKPKATIDKLFRAYERTVEFGKRFGGNFMHTYIYWQEFFSKPNLQEQAKRDPNFLDQLMKWMSDGKIINHKEMRLIDKWYAPGVKSSLRKKALAEINKTHGTAARAAEVFHDLSPEGTIGAIVKATKSLQTYKVSSLLNASEGQEIIKSLDELLKEYKNIKKLITQVASSGGASAA